jgi:hypothetical protein
MHTGAGVVVCVLRSAVLVAVLVVSGDTAMQDAAAAVLDAGGPVTAGTSRGAGEIAWPIAASAATVWPAGSVPTDSATASKRRASR